LQTQNGTDKYTRIFAKRDPGESNRGDQNQKKEPALRGNFKMKMKKGFTERCGKKKENPAVAIIPNLKNE